MRIRDEKKESLIKQKAIEMIVKHGFDGLSMQKLAKAAKVSPATIYIYFKDREDLIETISVEEVNTMTELTLRGFSPDMPFEKGLKKQWNNRAAYWINNPVQARFMEQVRFSPIGQKVHCKIKQEFSNIMREFVGNAIRNKELIPLQTEVFWSVAYAPLYQLIKFHLDGRGMHNESFQLDTKTLNTAFKLVIKSLKP
jgi:AcrR family transcriptional regulator